MRKTFEIYLFFLMWKFEELKSFLSCANKKNIVHFNSILLHILVCPLHVHYS
jgi:hypothetical protein